MKRNLKQWRSTFQKYKQNEQALNHTTNYWAQCVLHWEDLVLAESITLIVRGKHYFDNNRHLGMSFKYKKKNSLPVVKLNLIFIIKQTEWISLIDIPKTQWFKRWFHQIKNNPFVGSFLLWLIFWGFNMAWILSIFQLCTMSLKFT